MPRESTGATAPSIDAATPLLEAGEGARIQLSRQDNNCIFICKALPYLALAIALAGAAYAIYGIVEASNEGSSCSPLGNAFANITELACVLLNTPDPRAVPAAH